eukprot:s2472_g9.t1
MDEVRAHYGAVLKVRGSGREYSSLCLEQGDPLPQLLEESLETHLPSIGTSGANAVLLAAFLGRCWTSRRPQGSQGDAAPSLPAATYARLLHRLGRDFAESWLGLAAAGWHLPHESLTKALAEELCNVKKESFPHLAAAVLALAEGHRTQVATAVQKVSGKLPLQVAFSLLQAMLQDVCQNAEQATDTWVPLAVSLSSRALQDSRADSFPREPLRKSMEKCAEATKTAWCQVLELLEEVPERGLPEQAAPEPWQLDLHTEARISEEMALFWPALEAIPAQLTKQGLELPQAEKGASKGEGALQIDLYANPAAKAAQDAVVAALPPNRRCEALLSAAKAEAMQETVPALLEAWREAPDSCAAVLLRQTELQANWPIPVLAPVLTALIKEDAPGWKTWKMGPFDRGLLTATWAGLCRDPEVSAGFWLWALNELVVPNLSADATRRRFAADAARLLASTLKADLAARHAELQLDEILQAQFRSSEAVMRLQSLERAPLAPLVLSLAEVVSEEPLAEDALVMWLDIATGIMDLPEAATLQRHINMHLARIAVAAESATGYAGQLLQAALGGSTLDKGRDSSVRLLAACIRVQRVQRLPGQVELWPVLSTALRWPARRLAQLVLNVLPEIFTELKVLTPNGYVKGGRLDCSSKFLDFGVRLPVLRSIHCLYCCVVAQSMKRPSEASNFLRSACEVTRNAIGSLKVASLQCLSAHLAAFLSIFLDAVPPSPSPGMRAALLLVQSLRRKLGGKADCLSPVENQLKFAAPQSA